MPLGVPGRAAIATAAFWLAAAPALAGSISVTARLSRHQLLREAPVLLHPPYAPGTAMSERLASRRTYRGVTDRRGVVTFFGLPPGRYTVSFPELPPGRLQPSENPVHPAPVMTLFDDDETLEMDVWLRPGIEIGVAIEAPARGEAPYLVHTRHRATGFERVREVSPALARMTRLLSEGTWEIWVSAPPGQLLAGLHHGRQALPGDVATVELEPPEPPFSPPTDWLTFRYRTPAAISGDVTLTGGPVGEVIVVATLLQAGEWLEAAKRRGGSVASPVTAALGPDGRFRLDLGDGVWRVAPESPRMLASEPEAAIVEVAPDETIEVDFEVDLDPEPRRTFRVWVEAGDGAGFDGAVVHLVSLDDPTKLIAHGVTEAGAVDLEVVPPDDYLLLAGHPEYLEAARELYDFRADDAGEIVLELGAGADFYLFAADLDGRPARGVEWTVSRLHPPPDLRLRDPVFVDSKLRRVAVSDDSGRVRVAGFYGGDYRLRARRPARGDPLDPRGHSMPGGLFHVRGAHGRHRPSVEVHLPDGRSAEAFARQLPAAGLRLQLVCDDAGAPPAEASAFVVDLDGPDDVEAAKSRAALSVDDMPLGGKHSDVLFLGPLDQGVYRLAVQPAGFDRWTWYAETTAGEDAHPIPIDVDENEPAAVLDLGPFRLECSPAIDLAPVLTEGELPDLGSASVRARFLDPREDRELAASPRIRERPDRIELRGLPPGPSRLDLTLEHEHFLPQPDLEWRIGLDLRRGRLVTLTPQIPGVGGALAVHRRQPVHVPPGALVRVARDGSDPVDVPVETGRVLVPSLVPGVYGVTLCPDQACAEPLHQWPGVEIRRGETARLALGGGR